MGTNFAKKILFSESLFRCLVRRGRKIFLRTYLCSCMFVTFKITMHKKISRTGDITTRGIISLFFAGLLGFRHTSANQPTIQRSFSFNSELLTSTVINPQHANFSFGWTFNQNVRFKHTNAHKNVLLQPIIIS